MKAYIETNNTINAVFAIIEIRRFKRGGLTLEEEFQYVEGNRVAVNMYRRSSRFHDYSNKY